ncbi:hypothetical protein SAMN06265222_12034 [Neorhodopirellula lusitana]|uniref:N-sulphoglucosamine sulphohydrolase C-terminal domain-containing protein n=1 Tax=Neorhodopirellula lusitana TaxID=445327 RepID=A0ABY1QNI3_9BACT|nr:hypothetical protein [Neorhodopirellula lusitana]SMP75876.1 hypothetical protein SAMN06265222_12034 [Neorhodopirellula lusitana]
MGTPKTDGTVKDAADSGLAQMSRGPMHGGYPDIDPCPSLDYLVSKADHPQLGKCLQWSVDHPPANELYNIKDDPGCLNNLFEEDSHQAVKEELSTRLTDYLTQTNDPRVVAADGGDIFETYPRCSGSRWFPVPDWAIASPESVPRLSWLEERRPK